MNTLMLTVTKNHLEVKTDTFTTGGSINYDRCSFTFDSEWDGFRKTAVFALGNSEGYRVAIENDCCNIPGSCLEREGIIKIGVYGIKDDTVITTNFAAHRVNEGIDSAGEWLEEDYTLVTDAIKELETSAKITEMKLIAKSNSLSEDIRRKAAILDDVKFAGEPDSRFIPPDFTGASSCPSFAKGNTYEDFLKFRLDPLTTDFPEYAKKEVISAESSGLYLIYRYVFTPENYEKTIFISCCMHGDDVSSFLALSNFLDLLCRNYKSDRTLNYIHSRIKLVVIPVANPYGFVNAQKENFDSVDINRNFPYMWEECTSRRKGYEAADQPETQLLMNELDKISKDRLSAVLDICSSDSIPSGRTIYYPRMSDSCIYRTADILRRFDYRDIPSDSSTASVLMPSLNPTFTNYAADKYSVSAFETVWSDTVYAGAYTDKNISRYTEFIGNMLSVLAKFSTFAETFPPEAFTKHYSWKKKSPGDAFLFPASAVPEKMGISNLSFRISVPSNITLSGYIVLKLSADCDVKINPVLYQENSPEQDETQRLAYTGFSQELSLNAGTHIIPVSSVLRGYFSSDLPAESMMFCGKAGFFFAVSASVSDAVRAEAFSLTFNSFPCSSAKAVEINEPMGNPADYLPSDIPTQQLVFPLGTYSMADDVFDD